MDILVAGGQQVKIRMLLWSGFCAIIVVMTTLVTFAIVQFQIIDGHVNDIVRAGRNESLARGIAEGVNAMRRYQLNALVGAADERGKELERVAATGKANERLAEELEKSQRRAETRELAGTMRALNARYTQSNEQLIKLAKEDELLAMQNLIQGEARSIQRELSAASERFIGLQQESKAREENEAASAHALAENLMIALLLLAIILAVGIAFVVTRRIARQLGGEPEDVRQFVQRIASGDLRQDLQLRANDTQSLMAHQQHMQTQLRALLQDITATVERTESAAQTLASSAQQAAAAAGTTSESATSMAAVVEQMSVSITQVAESARKALKTASEAAKLSDSGGGVIEEATSEINRIADTVRRTSRAISVLDESSAKISTVVQVIKEVADQTNLLALNAAIEAARAGESGRGFAVVADEVRKLAERTGKATSEINAMVVQIQDETRNSLTSMETAVHQVDRGVELAGAAGAAIRSIRGSVDQVLAVVNEIDSAIEEQSIASQQIAQRVEQVAQASEENNVAAKGTAGAALTLSDLAAGLRGTVAQFRT